MSPDPKMWLIGSLGPPCPLGQPVLGVYAGLSCQVVEMLSLFQEGEEE